MRRVPGADPMSTATGERPAKASVRAEAKSERTSSAAACTDMPSSTSWARGMAIANRMPIIVRTITSSSSVYPERETDMLNGAASVPHEQHHNNATPSQRTIPMARLSLLAVVLILTSCRDPRAEANIAQAMTDVGTQMTAMQQDYALLQGQVDSLRGVVARQDTILGRLASMAGLPMAPR